MRLRVALLLLLATSASAGELRNAGNDAKALATAPFHWNHRQWDRAAEGAAVVAIVAAFDKPIVDAVQRNRSHVTNSISKVITPIGGGRGPQIAAVMFAAGALFHDSRLEGAGRDALISELWAAGLVTPVIKRVVGRARPFLNQGTHSFDPFSDKEHESFPSGHSTNAFALATAIANHYTSTPARVLLYSVASGVAFSRMNDNVHWASDVVAGALIGRAVAKGMTFRHTRVTLSLDFRGNDARSSRAFRRPSPGGPFASLPASLR